MKSKIVDDIKTRIQELKEIIDKKKKEGRYRKDMIEVRTLDLNNKILLKIIEQKTQKKL